VPLARVPGQSFDASAGVKTAETFGLCASQPPIVASGMRLGLFGRSIQSYQGGELQLKVAQERANNA
jgi:hypothetical protein